MPPPVDYCSVVEVVYVGGPCSNKPYTATLYALILSHIGEVLIYWKTMTKHLKGNLTYIHQLVLDSNVFSLSAHARGGYQDAAMYAV